MPTDPTTTNRTVANPGNPGLTSPATRDREGATAGTGPTGPAIGDRDGVAADWVTDQPR